MSKRALATASAVISRLEYHNLECDGFAGRTSETSYNYLSNWYYSQKMAYQLKIVGLRDKNVHN